MSPFFLKNTVIGPLELRPWTITTQMAITELDLAQLSEAKQVAACAWLQSRDPEEVESAIHNGTAMAELLAFVREFPLALARPVAEWCAEQSKAIEDARIEVLEKPGGKGDSPKN